MYNQLLSGVVRIEIVCKPSAEKFLNIEKTITFTSPDCGRIGASGQLVQYCEKVLQTKCANFVLCSREFSSKVRAKFRGG